MTTRKETVEEYACGALSAELMIKYKLKQYAVAQDDIEVIVELVHNFSKNILRGYIEHQKIMQLQQESKEQEGRNNTV